MRLSKYNYLLAAALLTLNCCGGINGKLKLVEGNFYFSRGMVNEAIGAYLDAADKQESAAYANFALGTTYLALEQSDAALERFARAEKDLPELSETRALLYSIRYNRGAVFFERGDFENAAAAFRSAIEADTSAREAKRNLELSLVSMQMKNQAAVIEQHQTGQTANSHGERGDVIFEYIRRHETDVWKSWEWTGEAEGKGLDY